MAGSKYAAVLSKVRDAPPALETSASPVAEDEPRKTGRPRSKSSDPRYRPITVVLQIRTIRLARRKLEDEDRNQDLSDLVQQLLTEWVGEQ